jgi:hypothetical protein
MIVSLPGYTLIHVFLSLIGVFAGLVVVGGLMAGVRFDRRVAFFFITTCSPTSPASASRSRR